ncbi:hypothetical protein ORIO_06405 [Cereibacter azotoformans]|uniref:hypothetical protein n=1 Tax=Cereibacter azotoformans TaxID=43057 RepID=UPI001EEB2D7D|nr:hypothetical protein [Cereibacter azotoformans]ULB09555.1 hypothetical protein ORIO_06405 [Cereibacter azotoformans]
MVEPRPIFADLIGLISAADLAALWGYSGPNSAFRDFCAKMRISPIPGRPGWYDPRLVRRRMDEAQGLAMLPAPPVAEREMTPLERRKARNGQI